MLKPAILYKDALEKLFAEDIYTERYFYYSGYGHCFELPNIRAQDNYYQWAIIDSDVLVGYLAYHIDPVTDTVSRFGLYSFSEGNQVVIRDTYLLLEDLVKTYHRLEWRIIEGNHAKRGYDNFCKKHHGNCVCLHDVTKDPKGNYRDEYIYEIIKD